MNRLETRVDRGAHQLHLASMKEEEALEVVASMINTIDSTSLLELCTTSSLSARPLWYNAMSVVACTPFKAEVADTLLQRLFDSFAPYIHQFQTAVQQANYGDLSAPLEELCEVYQKAVSFFCEWCQTLGVSGMTCFFAVKVRSAILQADLLTGEEPAGKKELLRFFRRHGEALLSRQGEVEDALQCMENTQMPSYFNADAVDEESQPTAPQLILSSRIEGCPSGAGRAAQKQQKGRRGSALPMDRVLRCLHDLTLSQAPEVKELWRSVLEDCIAAKLDDLEEDYSSNFLREYRMWLEKVVVSFVQMVLTGGGAEDGAEGGIWCSHQSTPAAYQRRGVWRPETHFTLSSSVRAEREMWCANLRELLLQSYARRRMASFWNILSDYPDSIPALEDVQYCLQSSPESTLKDELAQTVRHLLSSRLHRAGTRTEDMLAILINTIHAFCILFPRNKQSSVIFSVISDTLDYLRKRKDCVATVVQAIVQPGGVSSGEGATRQSPNYVNEAEEVGGFGFFDLVDHSAERDEDIYRTNAPERPDVLRVLLTAIHRRSLVDVYQRVLAEQLLAMKMHVFDTTAQEEVLERLKQFFGEAVLSRCGVMVRDLQTSRRLTQQLQEHIVRSASMNNRVLRRGVFSDGGATVTPSSLQQTSLSVLSMTTWPPLGEEGVSGTEGVVPPLSTFRPHPSLRVEMDRLANAFKQLKPNQKLRWIPGLGRVELEVTQMDPNLGNALTVTSHALSLFDASVVLYAKAASAPVDVSSIAAALSVRPDELRTRIFSLIPSLLLHDAAADTLALQTTVVSSSGYVFVDTNETPEVQPSGLPPEQRKLLERMITTLLKTRGPQGIAPIHTSLKLLAKFEGNVTELKELLDLLVSSGTVVLNDAKLYALPSAR